MFILITAECEVIGSETKVETFATKQDAHDAMVADAFARMTDAGIPHDEFDVYVDKIGDDGGFIVDVVGWQIREIQTKERKLNPNVAETVSYECKDDPTFDKGVLMHQATVRWNSGKSFDEHAPERIGLRVGGKLYEYKAI